jgi:acetyltransferase-like isoleucine patch superfamily enzyme
MIISVPYFATIGDDVLIEEAGNADTDFHSLDISRKTPDETGEKCRIVIGNQVSIGSRSLTNKGVKIGDDAIV